MLMSDAVMVPKEEYGMLKHKADLFDHFVEVEEVKLSGRYAPSLFSIGTV